MKDVIDIYGKASWQTSHPNSHWSNSYPGITFYVDRDKSLPMFPLNKEAHINNKIVKISITDN